MAVVYYTGKNFGDFSAEQKVKLLYVCQADAEKTIIPTALHAHPNHLELQYISGGKAHIRIGNHNYIVQEGDVVVYNAGILHDEFADPDCGMSFYNCGIKHFQTLCLPENHFLPRAIRPIVHTGEMSATVHSAERFRYVLPTLQGFYRRAFHGKHHD